MELVKPFSYYPNNLPMTAIYDRIANQKRHERMRSLLNTGTEVRVLISIECTLYSAFWIEEKMD